MRAAATLVLLAACTGGNPPPVDTDTGTPPPAGPALTVRTVDADGSPIAVPALWAYDPDTAGVPEDLPQATCADGQPPCAEWVVDALHPLTHVTSWRVIDGEPVEGCVRVATAFTAVRADPAEAPQVVHLPLPSDALWCVDGFGFDPSPPVQPADVRYVPEPPTGALAVQAVDPAGEPLPVALAHWYYDPYAPEYDGDHPMACADALCTRWVVADDVPVGSTIYVAVTYRGPMHPEPGILWLDFAAQRVVVGDVGEITLQLAIDLEAAY